MKKLFVIVCSLFMLGTSHVFAQVTEGGNAMKTQKILIAYYSHSGNTKAVAEAIHEKIGGELFEITAEGEYPTDYHTMTVQARKEIKDGYRPKLLSQVDNIAQYDVIFLGSPNWWGTITPQVSSFLESYDLSGKKIIPFITHGGGGVQNTIANMTKQCQGCDVVQDGWDGYGRSTSGLSEWVESLEL